MLEFSGLMDRAIFKIVPASETRKNCIFGSRFVDSIKHEGKPHALEKFWLEVQAYNDKNYGHLTYAPTVQRVSYQLLLEICAMNAGLLFFTRDVFQAYVQSETSIQSALYMFDHLMSLNDP